jgi:hypothetical protein
MNAKSGRQTQADGLLLSTNLHHDLKTGRLEQLWLNKELGLFEANQSLISVSLGCGVD